MQLYRALETGDPITANTITTARYLEPVAPNPDPDAVARAIYDAFRDPLRLLQTFDEIPEDQKKQFRDEGEAAKAAAFPWLAHRITELEAERQEFQSGMGNCQDEILRLNAKIAQAEYSQRSKKPELTLQELTELDKRITEPEEELAVAKGANEAEFNRGVAQGHKEADDMEDELAIIGFVFGELKREDLSERQLKRAESLIDVRSTKE